MMRKYSIALILSALSHGTYAIPTQHSDALSFDEKPGVVTASYTTTASGHTCATCRPGGYFDGGVPLEGGACTKVCSRYGYCGVGADYEAGQALFCAQPSSHSSH